MTSLPFPEPTTVAHSRTEVFLGYLDYFRARVVSKLEAMPDGGELRIGFHQAGDRLVITFRDNGARIDPDVARRLLGRGARAPRTAGGAADRDALG